MAAFQLPAFSIVSFQRSSNSENETSISLLLLTFDEIVVGLGNGRGEDHVGYLLEGLRGKTTEVSSLSTRRLDKL